VVCLVQDLGRDPLGTCDSGAGRCGAVASAVREGAGSSSEMIREGKQRVCTLNEGKEKVVRRRKKNENRSTAYSQRETK